VTSKNRDATIRAAVVMAFIDAIIMRAELEMLRKHFLRLLTSRAGYAYILPPSLKADRSPGDHVSGSWVPA
jgi:hypothetical protein